jgi:nucleotide-binding universal stress UspA family protein
MNKIVVGVDGSAAAAGALRWAARLAEKVGATVEAVTAWEVSYAWIDGYVPDIERWVRAAHTAAEDMLDAAVSSVKAEHFSDVRVTSEVVQGPAVQVLLDHAKDADSFVAADEEQYVSDPPTEPVSTLRLGAHPSPTAQDAA